VEEFMHPILFQVGNFTLRSFGLLMSLGVLCGSYLALRRAGKYYGDKVLDFCLWAVIAGIIGSRLWEVVFTWDNYRGDPLNILAIWQGGLSIQGGILGGVLAGIWWTRKEKIPFWTFADLVTPGLLLGQALGRVGCFLAGDDFGVPTTSWLGVIYAPGSPAYEVFGTTRLVPSELMEGLWDVVIIAILLLIERSEVKRFSGFTFALYLGLYSAGRIILENYRDYGLLVAGDWRTAQVAGALGIVVALVIFLLRRHQPLGLPEPLAIKNNEAADLSSTKR
jgi:phosphatidylglycerol---prolipoprotein diacylglyceryl transferase